jgi:predicted ferric reductase
MRRYDYTVDSVDRLNQTTLHVVLAPVADSLTFEAGQFVFVAFGGPASWERHPFTVSSAPQDRHLQLSIKTLGDYTQHLYETLQPGVPAIVGRAFGMLDYRKAGSSQVWIAGGIGITPFRCWIRSFPEALAFDIDFR